MIVNMEVMENEEDLIQTGCRTVEEKFSRRKVIYAE